METRTKTKTKNKNNKNKNGNKRRTKKKELLGDNKKLEKTMERHDEERLNCGE